MQKFKFNLGGLRILDIHKYIEIIEPIPRENADCVQGKFNINKRFLFDILYFADNTNSGLFLSNSIFCILLFDSSYSKNLAL